VRTALLAHEPSWRIRKDTKGTAYLIRAGAIYSQDASRTPYFVAIGHPLVDNQRIVDKFTQLYIALVTIIFFGSWLWGRRYLQQPFSVAWFSNLTGYNPYRCADSIRPTPRHW